MGLNVHLFEHFVVLVDDGDGEQDAGAAANRPHEIGHDRQ